MREGWSLRRLKTIFSTRLAIAFYSGMVAAVLLMLVVYLPLYFMGWSDVISLWSPSPRSLRAIRMRSFNQTGHSNEAARKVMVKYVMDWESPDIRGPTEEEKFGEEAYGEAHGTFVSMGTGSFLFVHLQTYRTGPSSFGVVGLGSKPLHLVTDNNPKFQCSWLQTPSSNLTKSSSPQKPNSPKTDDEVEFIGQGKIVINGTATKLFVQDTEINDRQEYIALVIYCNFNSPVGVDGQGGELKVVADHGKLRNHTKLVDIEFVALVEQPGDYTNDSVFNEPFQYEYLYCGSPLYGWLNPHRVREWIAYHMRLFGQNAHFIMYDVGGVNDDVWKVLKPWVKLGRVTIMNMRQQARYSAHLSNQFLLVNDCLLRAKTLAKWTFFFDLDEYIHMTKDAHLETSFHNVMAEMSARGRRATSIQIQQRSMSHNHCVTQDGNPSERWAIEKLLYRRKVESRLNYWPTHWQDFKTILQAKYVLAMGVHIPAHIEVPAGMAKDHTFTRLDFQDCEYCYENKMHYYHYRGIASMQGELCQEFVDPITANGTDLDWYWGSYEFDDTMHPMANVVREFEDHTFGPML